MSPPPGCPRPRAWHPCPPRSRARARGPARSRRSPRCRWRAGTARTSLPALGVDAGAVVDHARLAARRRRRTAASSGGCAAGEKRSAFDSRLTSTRCTQHRVGAAPAGARRARGARRRPGAASRSASTAGSTSATSSDSSDTASAPACTRLTSSRSVTSWASVPRLRSALSSSSRPVGGGEAVRGGAEARDGGGRDREGTAQVVADGGEQRGPHPVDRGERLEPAGGLGERALLQRDAELRHHDVEDAPVGGVEPSAGQLERRRPRRG